MKKDSKVPFFLDVSGTKQPFLFPCGNIKRDVLKTELQKEDIHLEEVTIYETIKNPEIETEFAKITENFTRIPEGFVYFSPSGVQSTKDIIERLGIQHSLKVCTLNRNITFYYLEIRLN